VHGVLGTGWDTSGQLVSALALVVALTGLYDLVVREGSVTRAGLTVALVAAFPTAFFLLAGYPEALALALTVWAFVAIRQRWWLAAGVLAAGATMTKYYLAILVVPLCIEIWQAREVPPSDDASLDDASPDESPAHAPDEPPAHAPAHAPANAVDRRTVVRGALTVGPVVAVLAAWAGYSDHLDGTPLAFARAQQAWGRTFAWPWTLAHRTTSDLVHLRFLDTSTASFMELFDAVTVVAMALLAVYTYLRIRRSYGVLLGLGWCVFCFDSILVSETREILVFFPFFVGLAAVAEEHPWRERLLLACFLPSAYFLIERFVTGRFAG
jgi:hypothetical protein